ncbi:MAG TPA: SulP family inorganic anion transporter [Actinophytocola sp.]|nr:SulP family inorganic anion transporter [Actinophytocola sp.]
MRRDWRFWRSDALAGLPGAVASVPDGMASAVLAGVNPVHGLYASFVGPAVGGLTSSTRLMVVGTTSAAALAAGSAVADIDPQHRADALFLLTILAGAVAVAAGSARLGRYTRFVSHSVMLGFLTGVAVNIVAGQISDLTGAAAAGSYPLAKAFSVLTHPSRMDLPTLLVGLVAIAILVVLARTRIAVISALVALLVPTLIVVLGGLDEVARVSDAGPIPRGIPLHGAPANINRDFLAQGAANPASGLFRRQPVGGSVGQTALNVSVGARTRWGAIWSGVWMLIILAVFSGVVGLVAMPTLAAILIFAAVGSVRPREIMNILRTGRVSQIAVVTTFLAIFVPAGGHGCRRRRRAFPGHGARRTAACSTPAPAHCRPNSRSRRNNVLPPAASSRLA